MKAKWRLELEELKWKERREEINERTFYNSLISIENEKTM